MGDRVEKLCLECGLCCNGVIFADVKLQPADDAARLNTLGLPLITSNLPRQQTRFSQPCQALDECRCRIYSERPAYCQQFECVLLRSVKAGRTNKDAALGVISTARKRAERVRGLLRVLGDNDEHLALASRFRRTTKRLESVSLDEASADSYGQLTLAVHDLNVLLSDAFYPGGSGNET